MLASVGLEGSLLVVASGACVGAEGSVWVDRVDRAIVRFFLASMLIMLLDFSPLLVWENILRLEGGLERPFGTYILRTSSCWVSGPK